MTPLIVGLLVLLVLGGGGTIVMLLHSGAAPTVAPGATQGASNGFTKYTDAAGVYSIQVPQDWLTTGNVALTSIGPVAQPGVRMEIERVEVALNGSQDDAANGFFTAAASADGASVTNRGGPTQVSLAGMQWYQYTGDLTMGSATEHLVLLAGEHSGDTVLIATFAPQDAFDGDDTKYFQPMLHSLTFLK
jgi:hypothetical protein